MPCHPTPSRPPRHSSRLLKTPQVWTILYSSAKIASIMAAKKIKAILKLNLSAGAANPAPPVAAALGQHGVNIMEFVNQYNAKTKDLRGQVSAAQVEDIARKKMADMNTTNLASAVNMVIGTARSMGVDVK